MLGTLDVFHVDLVVPDIQAAMHEIGANLAIGWAPPQHRTQKIRTEAGERRAEPIAFTYSSAGSPTSS